MGQFNAYTASQVTLGSSAPIVEQKIPLWVYSSGTFSTTSLYNSGSGNFVLKSSTLGGAYTSSAAKLYTLSNSWNANQKFAFEASIYTANSSAANHACLWDLTTNSEAAGTSTEVGTSSTTAILLRSGSFTLTPGHVYGIAVWTSNPSYAAYLTKAYLVALFT